MLFRLGLIAIVLSVVPWLAIAGAPLLGLSLSAGAGLVAGALVVAEVLFWVGLALAGKDTWQTIKARGWRRAHASWPVYWCRAGPSRRAPPPPNTLCAGVAGHVTEPTDTQRAAARRAGPARPVRAGGAVWVTTRSPQPLS